MKKALLLVILAVFLAVTASAQGWWMPPKEATIGVLVTEEVFHEPRPVSVVIVAQPPDPQVESAIIKHLIDSGYTAQEINIDPGEVAAAIQNPALGAAIARRQGFDILIIGEAFAEYAGAAEGLFYYRSIAEIRGISTADNRILFSSSITGTANDISANIAAKRALQDAGKGISGLIVPADKVYIGLAVNIVESQNFPKEFADRDLGWRWLNEVQDRILNELPARYEQKTELPMYSTSEDLNVSNRRAELIAQNPQYLIFFEIIGLKAKWYPNSEVDYSIEVRYQIIEKEGQKILATKTFYKERREIEPKFYDTSATLEFYYTSRFRELLKDLANEVYINLGTKLMDIIDTSTTLAMTAALQTTAQSSTENYIATVKLINGEAYNGTIQGMIAIKSDTGTTVQVKPEDMSELLRVYGETFKITLKNGSVIKGEILLPDMTLVDSLIGARVIKYSDVQQITVKVRTY